MLCFRLSKKLLFPGNDSSKVADPGRAYIRTFTSKIDSATPTYGQSQATRAHSGSGGGGWELDLVISLGGLYELCRVVSDLESSSDKQLSLYTLDSYMCDVFPEGGGSSRCTPPRNAPRDRTVCSLSFSAALHIMVRSQSYVDVVSYPATAL